MNTETNNEPKVQSLWLAKAQSEIVCGSIAAAAIAATAWAVSGSTFALGWVVMAQLIYGARMWTSRTQRLNGEGVHSQRYCQIGLAAAGLLWGAGSVVSLLDQGMNWLTGIVIVTTVALSILVLGCYLGRRALVLSFSVAALTPIGVAGLFILGKSMIAVSISSLLFVAVISISAKYIDKLALSFYATTAERDEYLLIIKSSEQEIKRLQVGVKTNNHNRLSLESELDEASSNLVISEGKADALASALDRVTPFDNATGLLNAKKYINVIEREWARMLRQEQPITVVHAQIDNFDCYKESYGNLAYEAAIRRIAELMRQTGTRPGDVVARLDENKFALLFPEADYKNGENLADVLRKQIRQLNMPNLSSPMLSSVTVSFGVCAVIPNSDLTIDEFSKRADAALYEAQFQGGDKVVRYRTMNNIKLERWDRDQEGELTPDGLVRKLAVLGYETRAKTYRSGDYQSDQRVQIDTIDAIVQGKLKVSLEGESRILHPGDCLFIPKGLVTSTEVVSKNSVICLEGTRV